MKIFLLTYALLSICVQNLLAQDMPVKYQDVSQEKMREQNMEIATLAAKEISKNLPAKIDKYTTLQSIKNNNATLVYRFFINDEKKSDREIREQDHSRMQKAITSGLCQSSKRFLQAGINISYLYISAKSKKLLFRFDVTKDKCNYPAIR